MDTNPVPDVQCVMGVVHPIEFDNVTLGQFREEFLGGSELGNISHFSKKSLYIENKVRSRKADDCVLTL